MSSVGIKLKTNWDFITANCKTELVFLCLSCVFLLIAFGAFVRINTLASEKNNVVIQKNNDREDGQMIMVDVGGAVLKPGVYQLPEGSRVKDALISSGGISASADRNYLAQTINAARPLNDGEKIFIPLFVTGAQIQGTSTQTVLGESNKIININLASTSELDTLPGVGEKTASKIIAGRPYVQIIELLEKKVVGQAVYDKIKDLIATY